MVPGESVSFGYPRGQVELFDAWDGPELSLLPIETGPVHDCTRIALDDCRVTTCQWEPKASDYGYGGILTVSSGANSQTVEGLWGFQGAVLEPRDFWEPGAAVTFSGTAPGASKLNASLIGPAGVTLEAPKLELREDAGTTGSAKHFTLDTLKPLDVSWSGAEGSTLEIILSCDDHENPGHSTEIRCSSPGEAGALTIPSSTLFYLPTQFCDKGLITVTTIDEKELEFEWPYSFAVMSYARTPDGVVACTTMAAE